MTSRPDVLTHDFRLAAEYRRCGWYLLLGATGIALLAALLRHHGLVPARGGRIAFTLWSLVPIVLASAALFAIYRWRLRVDELGVARRRLWRWDLWTWDEFESGKVKRQGNGFISTTRPHWRNELAFVYLDEKDREFVLQACRFFFQPAEELTGDDPSGELSLRYQLLCTVTFREGGIAATTGLGSLNADWPEIKEVRLLYFDHWSTEIRKIELELPTRTLRIEGFNTITAPGLGTRCVRDSKAAPRVVEDFLHKYVPKDKLARHAIHGPPATLSECEHRRGELRRELKNFTWCARAIPAVCLILTSLCFGPKLLAQWQGAAALPNVGWMVLATVLLAVTMLAQPLMMWAFLHEMRRRHTRLHRELSAWKDEYVARSAAEVDRTGIASQTSHAG